MGTVITMPLAGVLAEYIGWDAIFYVFGNLICIRRENIMFHSLSSGKHIFSNLSFPFKPLRENIIETQ